MKFLLIAAIAITTLAGCDTITVDAPKIAAPDIAAAPLPTPPALSVQAVGGLVCLSPEDALAMAEHVSADWPEWAGVEQARAEFYKALVMGEAANANP